MRTPTVFQTMDDVIERRFHPERGSPPPGCMLWIAAVETGFASVFGSFIEPAGQTQRPIGHGAKASRAWAADPSGSLKLVVTAGAQRRERGIDERSRELSGRSPRESGEVQVRNPSGGED